jgi:hypothetical protein
VLQSVKSLYGFRVGATDGLAGGIVDFYFNDQDWSVRQIVSSEHPTRLQKSVLIAPPSVRKVDAQENVLHVDLAKAEIAVMPFATTMVPVCRQYETRTGARPALTNADPHLRCATAVTGYEINDSEQHIGIVHDFLIDTKTWIIAFLVGRRFGVRERDFLVATSAVGQISFASRRVGIAKSSHWDLVFEERNGYDRLLNLEAA